MTAPHHEYQWAAYDVIEDIVFVLDAQRRFVYANAFTLNAWDRRREEIIGHLFEDVLSARPSEEVVDTIQRAIDGQQRDELVTYGRRHQSWLTLNIYPHHGGVLIIVRPTQRGNRTTAATDRDALTGCLTRQAFLSAHRQPDAPQGLAILDLNRLKAVNTIRGHGGGDLHIREVIAALQEALPDETVICRWGGDEFIVLAPSTSGALAAALARAQATAPEPIPGVCAFSFGVTTWMPGTPYERAFVLADDCLQQEKELLSGPGLGGEDVMDFVAFSQFLQTLTDPDELINHALTRLLTLLDFDHAVYQQWNDASYVVTHQVIRPGLTSPQPPLYTPQPLAGAFLTVQRTQRTTWSTDYPAGTDIIPSMVSQGVKSGIMTPVFSQGRIIATITLRTVHRWQTITPHMRKLVEIVALRLEHVLELRRAMGEVRSTLESGLHMLGVALEARDLETHGHTERTTRMATHLGAALGLRGTELDHLREGAYLHDLGKLTVPDSILQKAGPLTPEEWQVMQTHAERGWTLARQMPHIAPPVLDVIRHHHERWDGRGYPDRLGGHDIPLLARIFAVVDVYDALVSDRPYKPAWTPGAAQAEIAAQAGRQFDPDVVAAFLHLQHQGQPAVPQVQPEPDVLGPGLDTPPSTQHLHVGHSTP